MNQSCARNGFGLNEPLAVSSAAESYRISVPCAKKAWRDLTAAERWRQLTARMLTHGQGAR